MQVSEREKGCVRERERQGEKGKEKVRERKRRNERKKRMISFELEVPGYHCTMCAWCIISPVGLIDSRPPIIWVGLRTERGKKRERERDSLCFW